MSLQVQSYSYTSLPPHRSHYIFMKGPNIFLKCYFWFLKKCFLVILCHALFFKDMPGSTRSINAVQILPQRVRGLSVNFSFSLIWSEPVSVASNKNNYLIFFPVSQSVCSSGEYGNETPTLRVLSNSRKRQEETAQGEPGVRLTQAGALGRERRSRKHLTCPRTVLIEGRRARLSALAASLRLWEEDTHLCGQRVRGG